MLPVVLASMLSCSQAAWIIEGAYQSDMEANIKIDVIEEILKVSPDSCDFSQYDYRRT